MYLKKSASLKSRLVKMEEPYEKQLETDIKFAVDAIMATVCNCHENVIMTKTYEHVNYTCQYTKGSICCGLSNPGLLKTLTKNNVKNNVTSIFRLEGVDFDIVETEQAWKWILEYKNETPFM